MLLDRLVRWATLLCALLGWCDDTSCSERDPFIDSKLHSRLNRLVRDWDIPGLSLAVVARPAHSRTTGTVEPPDEGIEWRSEVLGFGKGRRGGRPVDGATYWAIASNSKLFTALSIGMLIEEHTKVPDGAHLSWTTKVKDILPDWKLQDEYASDHLEILDLLTMRSGMPSHDFAHHGAPAAEIAHSLRYLNPSSELRHDFQYNNMHYFVLAHVIETLANTSLPAFVQQRFFSPLNLTATYDSIVALESGRRSEGLVRVGVNQTACQRYTGRAGAAKYRHGAERKACIGTAESIGWWTGGTGLFEAGAGGIVMTGNDMTRWLQELLHPKLLPSALLDKTREPYTPASRRSRFPDQSPPIYGLAQQTYYHRGHRVVEHGGSLPGQKSLLLLAPDADLGLMVASNDDLLGGAVNLVIAYMVLDSLLGLPDRDWETEIMSSLLGRRGDWSDLPADPAPPRAGGIAGLYSHSAYGSLNLSRVHLDTTARMHSTWTSAMHSLRSHMATGPALNVTGPIYAASLNKTFATHLIITHFSGDLYNWTMLNVYDTPRGPAPSNDIGIGSTKVDEAGMGMFGNFWIAGAGVPVVHAFEDAMLGDAEVWFERIRSS